jgi:hypothetical protein
LKPSEIRLIKWEDGLDLRIKATKISRKHYNIIFK